MEMAKGRKLIWVMAGMTLLFLIGLILIVTNTVLAQAPGKSMSMPKAMMPMCISKAHFNLAMDMRKLWEDHIIWTRMYIVAAEKGTGDTLKSAERLLKNQEDIGMAIVPYYGKDAGMKLTELLKNHILIAANVVGAAYANDSTGLKDAQQKWTANADEIAMFLSKANPNWPQKEMTDMMHNHLALTTQEALARLYQDYATDVEAFDKVHQQALMMADMLTDGIVKQFPEKFKGQ
jgi:hypothetical protein